MNDSINGNRLNHAAELSPAPQPANVKSAAGIAVELLTVGDKDLAKMLGISPATVHRWDAAGLLGPTKHKVGGRCLWSVAEVKSWIAAGMPERLTWLALKRAHGPG